MSYSTSGLVSAQVGDRLAGTYHLGEETSTQAEPIPSVGRWDE